jgi:hypothetical protein
MSERKPITIRFRFNKETGQIEEFLIDDGDRTASEAYHDQIAHILAGELFRTPHIEDAGIVRANQATRSALPPQEVPTGPQREGE